MTRIPAILYTIGWSLFSLGALILAIRRHRTILLCRRDYWLFLSQPWRLIIFAVALVGFIVLAPYAGDPTWDWVDATFMGLLTFTTAPYALGVMVRCFRDRCERWQLLPAAALWLLSASWIYDAYVWWRDGMYPCTWWSNLLVSSILYFAGGTFWSLTVRPERGVTFAFLEVRWFEPKKEKLTARMMLVILLGVALVLALMQPFLAEAWTRLRG